MEMQQLPVAGCSKHAMARRKKCILQKNDIACVKASTLHENDDKLMRRAPIDLKVLLYVVSSFAMPLASFLASALRASITSLLQPISALMQLAPGITG